MLTTLGQMLHTKYISISTHNVYITLILRLCDITWWLCVYFFQSLTLRDIDDSFTCQQFGYASSKDYYFDASIHYKVHRVTIPLLALNSTDDVFSPAFGEQQIIAYHLNTSRN